MALSKSYEVSSGVTVTYWKVLRLLTCYLSGKTTATVGGYLDQSARDDGKLPVVERTLPLSALAETRDEAYPLLKQDILDPVTGANVNPVAGATDC